MIYLREEKHILCVRCGQVLEILAFYGLSSMLGPPVIICPDCHEPTPTGRFEWHDMHWAARGWYVAVSMLYTVVVVLFGMTSGWCVMYFWLSAFGKKLGDSTVTAIPGAVLWGGIAIIIQIIRVRQSLARSREGEGPPALHRWSLILGLQTKVMVSLFAVPIVAAILSLPVRWLVLGWGR